MLTILIVTATIEAILSIGLLSEMDFRKQATRKQRRPATA
jgi:hypothetical protein